MPACNNPIGFQMSSARRMTLAEIIQQEHLWVIEDDIHSFNNLCTASSFTNVSRTLTSTNDLLSGDDKICLYRLTHCVPCFPPLLRQEIERAILTLTLKLLALMLKLSPKSYAHQLQKN